MNIRRILIAYSVLFALLAAADLGSTLLGHQAGAREFNPSMADGARIQATRFIWANLLVGGLVVAMLGWALKNRAHVEPAYLQRPWRAALSWLTYLNPFAPSNRPRAIFHWTAVAISLMLVRAFAIGNNLAIAHELPDALTPIALAVDRRLDGVAVYLVTSTLLMAPFWIASLYLTRQLLGRAPVASDTAALSA